MTILLHPSPQLVTPAELQQDLLLLPDWRRAKAMRFRNHIDQVLCSKAYLLLCQGLRQDWGIDCSKLSFLYLPRQKPLLAEFPQVHFNLSHCKRGVLCVINNSMVGCDIEEIPAELDIELCRYCFNSDEITQIMDSDNPCVAFARLWTMKEAVLKLSGEGINDHLPELLTHDLLSQVSFQSVVRQDSGFVYTICQYASS